MLSKRHGEQAMANYREKLVVVELAQKNYQENADLGQFDIIYKFGDGLIDDSELELTTDSINMPGFEHIIDLPKTNPFDDMF
jgi:acetoacetyl-[acyl-carrier protein] synthase